MSDISDGRRDMPTRGAGAVILTATGVLAAFGAASCCRLPFLVATAGLGTAWLGSFALLAAPHRVLLLAIATVCLAAAVVLLWQQRVAVCASGAIRSSATVRGVTLAGLIVGLVLLYLGYTYA